MINEDLVVNASVFILIPTHSGIHDMLTADGLDAALDMLRCSSSTFMTSAGQWHFKRST